MIKIKRSTIVDLKALLRIYGRCFDALSPFGNLLTPLNESNLSEDIENEDVLTLYEDGKPLGFIIQNDKPEEFLFGNSIRNCSLFLDKHGLLGEEITCLALIAIDPIYQGKGLGKSLLSSFLVLAKEKTVLLKVDDNLETAIKLFNEKGFEKTQEGIYLKTKKKEGLCRNVSW